MTNWDGAIRLWDTNIKNQACQIAGRNLTRVEWERYVSKVLPVSVPALSFRYLKNGTLT